MIKIIVLVILSITLDNIINLYLNYLFSPLFTLISLISIYDLLKTNKIKYFLICTLIGFIYDLFFTNFYVLNTFIFLLISILIFYYKKINKRTLFKDIILNLLVIFIYNILCFIILNFFNYINYSIFYLGFILPKYIFINTLYFIIIRLIFNNKHNFIN